MLLRASGTSMWRARKQSRRSVTAAIALLAATATGAAALPATASAAAPAKGAPGSAWGTSRPDAKVPPVKVGETEPAADEDEAEPSPEVAAWRTAQQERADRPSGATEEKKTRKSAAAASDVVPEGQGDVPWHGISDFRITDSLVARVNYSTGNLMLAATDFDISGVGRRLQLTRTYNSLDAPWGRMSQRWWQGYERYLHLADDEVVLYGKTGESLRFAKDGDAYTTPKGYSEDLEKNSDGTYTLTDRKSGVKDTYNEYGSLTKITDRNHGEITVAQHDEDGENKGFKLTGKRSGRWIDLVKTDASQWQAKDHTGRTAVFDLNSAGDLAKTTDTEGKTTTFGYDSSRRLTRITTPEGRVTVFTYDDRNRVTSMLRATHFNGDEHAGPTYRYSYTADAPDKAGTTTVTDPLGDATEYEHNSDGEVSEVTDPLGHHRSRTYDANRNLATATDAMGTGGNPGNVTAYGWDGRNNPTSATLPTGATSSLTGYQTIAGADLPGTVEMPDGQETEYSYDTKGNTTSVAVSGDGGGERTMDYNETDPDCGGFEGQVCSVTDERDKKTKFSYDDHGNLTEADPPSPMGETTYTYDEKGRPATVTDGRGIELTYSYDQRDRVTKVTGPSKTVTYHYDGDGNLRQRDDSTGVVKYAFDPLSRETVRTLQDGSQTVLTYTADGNVASYEDPGGTTRYRYDAANRLTDLTAPDGKKTTYGYNNNDTRTSTTYPGGTEQAITVDKSNRPTRIKATHGDTTLVDLSYTYSYASGGKTVDGTKFRTVTDAVDDLKRTHTYDSAGRFSYAEETKDGERNNSWQYCYDPAGNLTSQGITEGCPRGTTYDYNDAGQITQKNGDYSGWSYDRAGNETSGAPTPQTARTKGTWSEFSQLTSTTVSGKTYDGQYASTDNSERVKIGATYFHHGPLGLSATSTGGQDTGFVREAPGTLNSVTRGGKSYYYLTDALGSTVAMVDEQGKKTASYYYSPRGVTIADEDDGKGQPYRFAGTYQDATAMYHMGARYYDPRIGRFTQPDPSGQEKNPYLYAEGDPVNRIDPGGLLDVPGAVGKFQDAMDLVSIGKDLASGDFTEAAKGSASFTAGFVVGTVCTAATGPETGFVSSVGCFAAGANTSALVESWLS
ncbi:RHS repeat-associated core domain-containing protein [Streptomyces qinglanensis]|uniref:RHS repeat-associated core domain-containing protein n=1 Tax=Streptomyces qinglanensis TaxID=943816 RepID=A0A1H9VB39_9ACTN|nr:RHS repeat-associated core domain-containing protein [Streptomyces qinglanensis]